MVIFNSYFDITRGYFLSTPDESTPSSLGCWGGTISVAIEITKFGGSTTINQPGFANPGLTLLEMNET